MNSPSMSAGKLPLPVKELVVLSLLGAIMAAGQFGFAFLPNIEPVSFLIICCTLVYGRAAFYCVYVFVLIEGLVFGFGIWWFTYLYIWAILVLIVLVMRGCRIWAVWAVISGAYGLMFGFFSALPYLFIGGAPMALSYWASGIPFDLLHCAGNFVLTLCLIKPCYLLLSRLKNYGA